MFPKTIRYSLEVRKIKGKKEYALFIQLDSADRYVIKEWKIKPKKKTIDDIKELVYRSIQIYYSSIKFPISFSLIERNKK